MKTILRAAIAILLILGIAKTFQEHDVASEASNYYAQLQNSHVLENVENLNFEGLKNINFDDIKPSDFL